jgi:hypothetical protein
MKPFACLALVAACVALQFADRSGGPVFDENFTPKKPAMYAGDRYDSPSNPYAGERVTRLPDDAGMWHTVVVFSSHQNPTTADRRLAALLTNNRVQEVMAQTHIHNWDQRSQLYDAKYREYIGNSLPAFLLENHKGQVIYRLAGANMPATGDQMFGEMMQRVDDCCRPRPQQDPNAQHPSDLGRVPIVRPGGGGGATPAGPVVAGMGLGGAVLIGLLRFFIGRKLLG